MLYSTLGAQWVYPQRITFSFVPDGTDLGGAPSNLNSAMAAQGITTQQWQTAIDAAAAVWQEVANVNLVQVSDNGAPMGSGLYQQGDPGMGDIRIAGVALGGNYLGATACPPPINGDSIAGDILLATDLPWHVNGSIYDLETVALHEFGHALGMDHSAISQAVMYAYYNTTKQALNADDVAGIQSIYGARQPDQFDTGAGNNWYTTATNLSTVPGFSFNTNAQATLTGLDINSRSDQDWLYVTAPSNTTGTFQVTMQSSGLSLLAPRVMVYNSSLRLLGNSSSAAFGDTVSVSVSGVQSGQGFYVRLVNGSTYSYNDTGAYALQLNFGSGSMSPVAPPTTTVYNQPDQGGGDVGLSTGGNQGNSTPGSGFGYGFASRLVSAAEQALEQRLGHQIPGLGNTVSTVTGTALDQANGLLKIGNLSIYGDVLAVKPSSSPFPGSHQGFSSQISTTLAPLIDAFVLTFLPDADNISNNQKSDRSRGR